MHSCSCTDSDTDPKCTPNPTLQAQKCGMFKDMNPSNPFFDCLTMLADKGMDDAVKMATSCEYDVCQLQDNADQVTEAACSALSNLNQVCEIYNKYPDWRASAACRKYSIHPFVSMRMYFCTRICASIFILFAVVLHLRLGQPELFGADPG